MTTALRTSRRRRLPRPPVVWATTGSLGFLGATATGGAVEMLAFPKGTRFVPGRWLDDVPFVDSWVLPGLALGGLGIGSLVTAVGIWRHGVPEPGGDRVPTDAPVMGWPWVATLGIGIALAGWIGLEVAFIPERSALEGIYGGLAVGLAAVAAHRLRGLDGRRTDPCSSSLDAPGSGESAPVPRAGGRA